MTTITKTTIRGYIVHIHSKDEDGDFMLLCPKFPGLSAFAKTEEELLKEGEDVIDLFVTSHEVEGLPVPEKDIV